MTFAEIKADEMNEQPAYFVHCDIPGCSEEDRNSQFKLIEDGWAWVNAEVKKGDPIKKAICPDHREEHDLITLVQGEIEKRKEEA